MKIFQKVLLIFSLFFLLVNCNAILENNSTCKRIAFSFLTSSSGSNPDIYSVCPDGSQLVQLTDDPAFDGDPAWSPDGKEIAFVSERSGTMQVYRMDADGGNVRQLTTDLQNDQPIWIPDGGQITFRTTDGQGSWWWRAINLDSGQVVDLTDASYDFFFQKQAWSPVNPEIAYMSLTEQAGRNDGSSQIHVKAIDGSSDRALTNNIWANVNPVWSPDGTQLAFLSEMHGEYNVFALYTMGVYGEGVRQISDPIYTEQAIYSWSPDGTQIAIGDLFIGRISIINLSTGLVRDLISVNEGETALTPAWQP